MIYESKFMLRIRLEGRTDETDKNNSVSFVSDSLRANQENRLQMERSTTISDLPTSQAAASISGDTAATLGSPPPVLGNTLDQWLSHCQPGDDWWLPEPFQEDAQRWQRIADARIRHRDPRFRVWRNVDGFLVCKLWLYD